MGSDMLRPSQHASKCYQHVLCLCESAWFAKTRTQTYDEEECIQFNEQMDMHSAREPRGCKLRKLQVLVIASSQEE